MTLRKTFILREKNLPQELVGIILNLKEFSFGNSLMIFTIALLKLCVFNSLLFYILCWEVENLIPWNIFSARSDLYNLLLPSGNVSVQHCIYERKRQCLVMDISGSDLRDDSLTRGQSNMRRLIYEKAATNIREWSLAYSFICIYSSFISYITCSNQADLTI